MPKERKPWFELHAETRARYRRAHIDQESYENGTPLPISRSKPEKTVKRRTGAFRKPTDGGSGRA